MPTPTVADEAARIIQAKADIKSAIEAKGVTVPSSAKIDTYDDYVTAIQQGGSPNLTTLQVTPTTQAQVITPTSPVDGYNEVDVVAVTSAIDSNITAGNIKKDVSILGVTGTYEGGGGTPTEEKTVRFRDYDGTLLYEYTPTEFAALSAMPSNPTHTGLTAQGWNWTLQGAKTYVAAWGAIEIGQMYTTSDGKTRLYITIDCPSQWQIYLYFGITSKSTTNILTINWGDGSAEETASNVTTSSKSHKYTSAGDFVITLSYSGATNTGYYLGNSSSSVNGGNIGGTGEYVSYGNVLKKVEMGQKAGINTKSFYSSTCLQSIAWGTNNYSISSGSISNNAFNYTNSLRYIVIPTGFTSLSNYCFQYSGIEHISLPETFTTLASSVSTSASYLPFYYCIKLKELYIPSSCTMLPNGFFNYCDSLEEFIFPGNTVGSSLFTLNYNSLRKVSLGALTSCGSSTFNGCEHLTEVKLSSNTTLSASMFNGCRTLESLTVPSGVTVIPDSFVSNDYNLKTLTLPNSVTTIGTNYAYNNYNRRSITIPEGVTSIGNNLVTYNDYIQELVLPSTLTALPTSNGSLCTYCRALEKITIKHQTVTLTGGTITYCTSLKEIIFAEGVQSITFSYAIINSNGNGLRVFRIPSTVTSISGGAYMVAPAIYIDATTPPTLNAIPTIGSSNTNWQSHYRIYVPNGCLTTYQTATTWSGLADYMVEMPANS